jgi:hypothetical protein
MADDMPQRSKSPEGNDEQQASSAQARGPSDGSPRRMVMVTLAAALCVLVAGIGVAVFWSPRSNHPGHIASISSSPSSAGTRVAQPTAPTASGRGVSGPEVTSDGIAKTAVQAPPRLKHQILRWKAGPGGAALSSVTLQLGTAMQAAGARLYAPTKQACQNLASTINTAQAAPTIPYGVMQRLYARALTGLSTAAADCRNAISQRPDGDESLAVHVNMVLLNQAMAALAAKSRQLYMATAEIRALRS